MRIPRPSVKQFIILAGLSIVVLVLLHFAFQFGDDFYSLWTSVQANLHKAAYHPDGDLRVRSILLAAFLISASMFLLGLFLGEKELTRIEKRFRQRCHEIDNKQKLPFSASTVQASSSGYSEDLKALQRESHDHYNQINNLKLQIANLKSSFTALSQPSDQALSQVSFSTFSHLSPLAETSSYNFLAPPPLPKTPLPSLLNQVIQAFPHQDFFEERKTQFRPMALGQLDSQLTPEGQHKITLLSSKYEAADYLIFYDGRSELLVLNPLSNRFSSSLHDLKEGGSSLYEYRAVHGRPLTIVKIARLRAFDESCWVVDEKGLIEGGF